MSRAVVLDTNAALLPFKDGTNLGEALTEHVGDYHVVLPTSVVEELTTLSANGGALGRAASAALKMFGKRTESTELPGDDGVLDVGKKLDAVVVTNDKRLQAECARRKIPVLGSRGHALAWRDGSA